MFKIFRPLFFIVLLHTPLLVVSQENRRSIDDIFPALSSGIKEQASSSGGYFVTHNKGDQTTMGIRDFDSPFRAQLNTISPSVVIESLFILPYQAEAPEPLAIYNGLRHVRNLKGRLYHSDTRGADVPLFEDATRLESAKRTRAIDDPPPRQTLPDAETIYIRLKDINFGNSYYQADVKKTPRGFTYSLSNNRNVTYGIFTVIRSGNFITQFYFEPIDEGILIYVLSGAEVSNFIASKIDIPSAIQKRLAVIIGWAVDGVNGRL
jgi:hypothetical protein